ncbi:hypothetical protein RJ641_004166 [Dillenia turbinata]|uniref:RING-type domain-containing protein n=1 Tax=Dillenia turbinata TaxID=194707 RepID=A0AAN8VMG9_9MAGN
MASMVAKGSTSSSQISPPVSVHEKGSRNKRKFRADPPTGDPTKILSSSPSEFPGYEFSAEKFEISPSHEHASACDVCSHNQEQPDALKLNLGLPSNVGSFGVGPSQSREDEDAADEFHDADWSDFTETQLEELVLSNLDAIFKSAIKKIADCGYSEEVASKAVLRSGLFCYGCKDIVSNIVENTLAFLKNGQEIDPSREHYFDDLQQLEKYILAELVCVLRELRPFFSTGDAMWCLLICDMNVSHACAMEGDPLNSFLNDGVSNSNASSSMSDPQQLKSEAKGPELNLPGPSKLSPSFPCSYNSQLEVHASSAVPNVAKPKNSNVPNGLLPEKESLVSISDSVGKSFSATAASQPPAQEEKFVTSRKLSGCSRREYILRQKSLHVDKSYRIYGSKGVSRSAKTGGFGSLILDKKLKAVSDSGGISLKNASFKVSKPLGVDIPSDNANHNHVPKGGLPSSGVFSPENVTPLSKTSVTLALPAVNNPPTLSTADTVLSLSLPLKNSSSPMPLSVNCNTETACSHVGIPYDKCLGQWIPQDKKDEMILKLVPRVRELQNQLQEWTEWANQKVMQAARRLTKDKGELKTLRQEKEEVERLKKEKQTLEENTMKKLSEMENALCKASGQVERANAAVRRLEVENAALRQDMEAAKLRAAESAASCQEVSKREKKTLVKFQSWEKQKGLIQEELAIEKRKVAQLLQEVEHAKNIEEQFEGRWLQEKKATEELLVQASSLKKEREQIGASGKSKEDMIKLKAENNLQKYKDDIKKLELEISQLRLKADSSKIAALKRGIDGSYASKLGNKSFPATKDSGTPYISEMARDFLDNSNQGGVKRERECVMCLSEEMSVVFLPCNHQVVCTTCNELHEKQGMKDCPSCRSPIQQRICVRYARS